MKQGWAGGRAGDFAPRRDAADLAAATLEAERAAIPPPCGAAALQSRPDRLGRGPGDGLPLTEHLATNDRIEKSGCVALRSWRTFERLPLGTGCGRSRIATATIVFRCGLAFAAEGLTVGRRGRSTTRVEHDDLYIPAPC